MCGILGIISKKQFSIRSDLLGGLKRLEYRGYDSAGFSTKEGILKREVGYIDKLISKTSSELKTDLAIAHTRWATHGNVTRTNAHPHTNKQKDLYIIHNGIIENYLELRSFLEKKGFIFYTQTDSEVIAHYFDYYLSKGEEEKKVIQRFLGEVLGTFAILIIRKGQKKLYALKRDSPLALGIAKGALYFASDIYAFINKTNEVIFFEDNEYAIADQETVSFFDWKAKPIKKKRIILDVPQLTSSKEKHPHYMIKEIKEQPISSQRILTSFETSQKQKIARFAREIKRSKRIVFISCGTSYHASLVGVYLFNSLGIEAHAIVASEFENFFLVDKDTLVIAISQSGETMDVVSVLKDVKEKGAKTAAIVNVPYSTIQRMSTIYLETLAGPEICVASTKVFTNQILALLGIAKKLGYDQDLTTIPASLQKTIDTNESLIRKSAKLFSDKKDFFVIGKGLSYPLALEIALKLKEIAYIHAEGMMAGELKHGTIALVEPGIPIISLIPGSNADMLSSTKEVEARGAKVITISNHQGMFVVPDCDEVQFVIYATMVGHLFSYYVAKDKRLPIDKPRNLAKSVTVK